MLTRIFGDCSQVKVIDFLVAHPWSEFSKTELADGAQITRPTLYKLLDKLLDENLIIETKKVGNAQLYQTNREYPVIKYISSLQGLLADMELKKQRKSFKEVSPELNDEELDELLGLNSDENESKSIKKPEDLSEVEVVSSDAPGGTEIKQVNRVKLH